jgi:hypothetical protein
LALLRFMQRDYLNTAKILDSCRKDSALSEEEVYIYEQVCHGFTCQLT